LSTPGIEYKRPCEIDTIPVSQTNALWQNLENAIEVGLLLLTIDFDTYWDYTVCRYSNDQISWWSWKH